MSKSLLHLSVLLKPKTVEEISKISTDRNISPSTLIRYMIEEHLEIKEKLDEEIIKIDLKYKSIDILVDGQQILQISQISDETTTNLLLYSEEALIESTLHKENKNSKCTHEIIIKR